MDACLRGSTPSCFLFLFPVMVQNVSMWTRRKGGHEQEAGAGGEQSQRRCDSVNGDHVGLGEKGRHRSSPHPPRTPAPTCCCAGDPQAPQQLPGLLCLLSRIPCCSPAASCLQNSPSVTKASPRSMTCPTLQTALGCGWRRTRNVMPCGRMKTQTGNIKDHWCAALVRDSALRRLQKDGSLPLPIPTRWGQRW